ncbi:preprotein translocase subunit Tim44 [Methylibium sp. Pch-M]|uniref:Tim44 domain-containing protein n=1 Tax=Methylibium sp. Pch-M TaxID=2082386 RepID=UPI001011E6AB|nr:TIM44-like domain-containing protein [Methylibium sp. Pch-M]QAZ40933.1 preprotein translocase subunit Tim44 [Methylibium sp. Pch-M]
MKRWWLGVVMAASLAVGLAPTLVEAKRLGGGGSAGMKRSLPPRSTPDAPPAKPAATPNQAAPTAPAAAGTAAAAAAPKRSWMGPIAGLAAGLGIAALMSHLGLGEAFGNFLMLALLAVAAVFLIRFVMRRMAGGSGGARPALAGAGAGGHGGASQPAWPAPAEPLQRRVEPSPVAAVTPAAAVSAGNALPADFDAAGFERLAKQIFIRLQAANDTADLNDLRAFTTPELFASLRLDLQERGETSQQTDVLKIDAEVLDLAREDGRQVVSVRFHGLVRELSDAAATDFDEVWHLVKPDDDSRPWAIAGIEQRQ